MMNKEQLFMEDKVPGPLKTKGNDAPPTTARKRPALVEATGTGSGVFLSETAAPVFAMVLVLIASLLFLGRGPIAKWYYAKKIGLTGLAFSSQDFLTEVSKNHEEAVDLFIKAGIPLDARNDKGQTALMIAAEKEHLNLLGKLTALDAALLTHADASGNTALMTAARQGKEQSIKVLLEKGAEVNYVVPAIEGPATPLQAVLAVPDFTAAHMNVVNQLLQHGATVTGKNTAGRFPLLFAAEHGRMEAAALLIEKGAYVNDADLKGNFPLLFAAGNGNAGLVTLLLDKGANMKMALPDGQTPFMRAAKEGRVDAVKVLLEHGAVVNARTRDGSTALTAAARTGNVYMVKLLLEKGADPSSGHLPDSFLSLNGKEIVLNAKKSKLSDVLRRIAKTASLDGYAITLTAKPVQKINLQIQGAWNRVLAEVATSNHLSLIVKDATVYVLPYDPAAIKRVALVVAPAAAVR
jgi:ankyrin repeat protein